MKLSSQELERRFLGSIIRNPNVFFEIDNVITELDFTNSTNGTIFNVIRQICHSGETLNKVILAQKIKNLGISFPEDIETFDYIESISAPTATEASVIDFGKELKNLTVRREIKSMAETIIRTVSGNPEQKIEKLIADIDLIYGNKINSFNSTEEIQNLFDSIEPFIEEKGNNAIDESGLIIPHKDFTRLYGGLRNGNLYAIVARPANGKSTYLLDMSLSAYINNPKIKVLYLDTEMFTEDVKLRITAAQTGVPFWYIDSGNWRKNPEMTKKVRFFLNQFKAYEYFHHCVGNKNVDEIISIIRRWYYSKVGRGNQALICYDYVKLTGEKMGQHWAEHQAIGDKIDKLKKISEEINCPLFTAMQMNRSGENFNKSNGAFSDDSSAIALSDRLQWFASYVGIFRRKTHEEIERDTIEFGTHKLITLKSRFQGKDARGHYDLIRRRNDHGEMKYVSNYINFNVENFKVEEKGTLERIVEQENEKYALEDKNKEDGDVL